MGLLWKLYISKKTTRAYRPRVVRYSNATTEMPAKVVQTPTNIVPRASRVLVSAKHFNDDASKHSQRFTSTWYLFHANMCSTYMQMNL